MQTFRKAALTGLLALLAMLFLFPVALTFTNSLMSETEISASLYAISDNRTGLNADDPRLKGAYVSLKWIPDRVTLSAYYEVLVQKPQFLRLFWNSVRLTLPIIAGQLVVASLAAYAFAHLRFRFREPLFFLYIVTMLMPFQVTLVPNFIMADKLGLLNTYGSIVYPGMFSAFGVFLLRQYMMYIPYAYMEAARVDGAGPLRTFALIIVPMSRTGMAALAILVFIDNWNMVEQPLIFLQEAMRQPLSVYLAVISTGERGLAFAACALYMLPALLIMLYAEKDLIEGIQLTGLKG